MTTNEMAAALGEKPKTILDLLRKGSLQGEKVADPNAINGVRWDVTTPLEEARTIAAGRVRRKTVEEGRRVSRRPEKPPVDLPLNRDLFKPQEAARLAGISEGRLYRWLRENKILTLRNGRSSYIPRNIVERMRAELMPKAEPTVVSLQSSVRPDPALYRIERELIALKEYLRRFAESCGFKG